MLVKNLELNGTKLDVAVVMQGQTPRQVKKEIGWPKFALPSDGFVTVYQESFDIQQEMIQLLKSNGVDTDNMVAWIEHHDGGNF